jgi:Fe-Mn family superoxide dismutase
MSKIDLGKIVEESLAAAGLIEKSAERIDEALVAQQKHYPQVTETVSQKTKDAHGRLYKNYIEKFNRVSAELDSVSKETDHNFAPYRELKVAESYNLNAIWLHELYFANCFDPNSEIFADSYCYLHLQRDFGTFEEWQRHFIAAALSARQGWAVCGYNVFLRKYVNTLIDGHSQNVMLGLYPILVIDMWDHASFRDYLDDKQSFLVAQMREINWTVVEDRVKRAERIAEVLK